MVKLIVSIAPLIYSRSWVTATSKNKGKLIFGIRDGTSEYHQDSKIDYRDKDV